MRSKIPKTNETVILYVNEMNRGGKILQNFLPAQIVRLKKFLQAEIIYTKNNDPF